MVTEGGRSDSIKRPAETQRTSTKRQTANAGGQKVTRNHPPKSQHEKLATAHAPPAQTTKSPRGKLGKRPTRAKWLRDR